MSRKKRRPGNRQQKQQASCRYIISLADWKRYEHYKEVIPQIEEALTDLQESWVSHLDYLREDLQLSDEEVLEEIRDNIVRLEDLVKGINGEQRKKRSYVNKHKQYDSSVNHISFVGNRPKQRYDNMVAEIIIKDITEEDL